MAVGRRGQQLRSALLPDPPEKHYLKDCFGAISLFRRRSRASSAAAFFEALRTKLKMRRHLADFHRHAGFVDRLAEGVYADGAQALDQREEEARRAERVAQRAMAGLHIDVIALEQAIEIMGDAPPRVVVKRARKEHGVQDWLGEFHARRVLGEREET